MCEFFVSDGVFPPVAICASCVDFSDVGCILPNFCVVRFMKKLCCILAFFLSACGGTNNAADGAVVGTVAGAGVGAIVGDDRGHAGAGAAIGAGAGFITGAAAGAIADASKDHDDILLEQQEIIRRQEEEMKRQDREIQDIKRQQYHNEGLRRFERK